MIAYYIRIYSIFSLSINTNFRWPLIWDPDELAFDFVLNLHKDRKVKALHFGIPNENFMSEIYSSVKTGDVLVLYDIKYYDSAIANLLKKRIFCEGKLCSN
jgi:hypothetical protein